MPKPITIVANAVKAKLIDADEDAKLYVSDQLSYYVDGYDMSDSYRSGNWDGRSTFFDYGSCMFPAGFVSSVTRSLTRKGYKVLVRRKKPPTPLGLSVDQAYEAVNPFEIDPKYDYQPETVKRLLKYGQMIAQVATGGGKCHRKGTPVIMADASIKNVEDVKVGDQLASPTGDFRTVKGLARGSELMYRITPVKGDTFYCNASHVLSLRKSGNRNTVLFDGQTARAGETVEVSADVLFHSSDHAKHCLKLWRPDAVAFQSDSSLPMPAYILGAWLGDGSARMPGLSTPPCKMADEWRDYVHSMGLSVREVKTTSGSCSTLYATGGMQGGKENPITKVLRDLGVIKGDHKSGFIPSVYKRASVTDRLELLAGLMDSDGHARHGNRGFDFVSKYQQLAEDVVFVARSLGLSASIKKCTKTCQNDYKGTYWRVAIGGDHHLIPSRDKPSGRRVQKKDPRVTGFKIEPVGVEDYYGFELDGDHLYMLGDFTVQHNSMVARTAVKAIMRPSIFLTTRQVLMYQMKAGFEEAGFNVGVMGDGEWSPKKGINVATVQTIHARLANAKTAVQVRRLLQIMEFAILEEAHEASSDTFYDVMAALTNAHYRLSLTATPFMREDGESNMRLMAVSGAIGIKVSEKLLIDRGILARPIFKYVKAPMPGDLLRSSSWQKAYDLGIVNNEARNGIIVDEVVRAASMGLPGMILVQRKNHGAKLKEMLKAKGIRVDFIYGGHDKDRRQRALNKLKDGTLQVLIGSTILDVGVDVPAIGIVALAGGGKAEIALRQRIGRGLRAKKVGPNVCMILDFEDSKNKHLINHYKARRKIIESTPGFSENILKPGEDFPYRQLGYV